MTTISLDGEPIGEVKRLNLGPNDAIVIECSQRLTMADADRIRNHVRAVFPGTRVLVVPEGCTVGVAGPDDQAHGCADPELIWVVGPDGTRYGTCQGCGQLLSTIPAGSGNG